MIYNKPMKTTTAFQEQRAALLNSQVAMLKRAIKRLKKSDLFAQTLAKTKEQDSLDKQDNKSSAKKKRP